MNLSFKTKKAFLPKALSFALIILLFFFLTVHATAVGDSESGGKVLYAGGIPFGVKFFSRGVVVAGFCGIAVSSGGSANPALSAGLRISDIIISVNGSEYETLACFGYATEMYTDKRFSGDILTSDKNIFESELIGYINTSCVYSGIKDGLCEILLNPELGNDKKSSLDGFREGNFFATQLIGPFTVKNPYAMKKICEALTGETLPLDMTSHQGLAYKRALTALEERMAKK